MATPNWRMTLNRARGHATQTCSLWRVSFHSSKTELSQTFPAMNRKEYTQRHLLNQGQRKPPFHPTPPLQAGRARSPSAAPRPWRVCRLWLGAGRQLCFVPVTALSKGHSLPQNGQKVATFAMRENGKEKATARGNSQGTASQLLHSTDPHHLH